MEYVTRMGDGRTVMMTKEQIYEDAVAGMADAVDAAGVPDLTQDDLDQICEIICNTNRVVAVERGKEVILTEDGGPHKFILDSGSCCNGVEMGRIDTMEVIERAIGFDTFELTTTDYSIKPVKPSFSFAPNMRENGSRILRKRKADKSPNRSVPA